MFQDGVVSVHVPEQGITVLSNGVLVEVVAPQLLKSRAVGLCGDMNGERSADLKTPGLCVMRPHLAALSYLINKSGSASGFERCSGIPSTLNRPVGMIHVVEKQSTKLCISKQMVKTCLSKPLSIKQKSVEFCLMESGLERQVLTICLEMHSLVDCFSTTWVIPTGLLRIEILSARIETGVGIRVSRAHWADSVWNSVLRVAGMPEQRSKPEAEPDLLMR